MAASAAPLDGEQDTFIRWLFGLAGLDAASYRPETLCRRLNACLRALRASDIDEARAILAADPAKVLPAIGALVIGVSSFFRDAGVFDHLTYTVLQSLPRHRRSRIWCAGCSDGQELYSIAILLAEMGLLEMAELLGTDCRAGAIARARCGCFDRSELGHVPTEWRDKYFLDEGGGYCASPRLRSRMYWRVADVTRIREAGAWDLICCRNVSIYLRTEVSADLWAQLQWSLRPGGYLVVGKAERPTSAIRLTPVSPCIYQRDRG